tara:strand:+ start:29198 stop:30304 length:1107 start_codon:yes stop_codon:yes gene_type:complete
MTKEELDNYFIKETFKLAKKGEYIADPNPMVGAVLVKNNKIISSGYHKGPGNFHAEYIAIKKAGKHSMGSTLYVNLEPCCHFGRTPPCSDYIIKNKIKRVVISTIDPNPLISGKSIKQLKKNGIEVTVGIFENEAKKINAGFFTKFNFRRPYIVAKSAISLDGKISTVDSKSRWITSKESRQDVHIERAKCSAILTTSSTVLADDPKLNVRGKEICKKINSQPYLVLLDTNLRISNNHLIFKNMKRNIIIFTCKNITSRIINKYKKNVQLFKVKKSQNGVDLTKTFQILADLNIHKLLVESGNILISSLLNKSYIDEFILYVAPKIFGNNAKTFSGINNINKLSDKIEFDIDDIQHIKSDIKLKLKRK